MTELTTDKLQNIVIQAMQDLKAQNVTVPGDPSSASFAIVAGLIVPSSEVTVKDVLEYLASGMSREEILEDFPYLEDADITACLDYAAHREEHLRPIAV